MRSFAETWLEEGRQEGRQEGKQEEAATLTLRQLHRRVGILDAGLQARILRLPLERLVQLSEDLLDFTAREEVTTWMFNHAEDEA